MLTVTWGDVFDRRVERHALATPSHDTHPAGIVRTRCGAHAQVMSAAELSIGLRIAGITQANVRAALWGERSLVKTRGPRGTIHLLATQDLPMWTDVLGVGAIQLSFPRTAASRG